MTNRTRTFQRLKLRRAALISAAIAVVVLSGVLFRINATTSAQDDAVLKPRYETTYRTVTENNVTRMVPETRVVYSKEYSTPNRVTFATPKRDLLPHTKEIGPLVQSILNASTPSLPATGDEGETFEEGTEKLRVKLESMLGDQFDAMSAEQKKQIDQLTERVERLKAQHLARNEARKEIIGRRMNQLLRQPDPLAWDPNGGRQNVNDLTPPPARVPFTGSLQVRPTPSTPARQWKQDEASASGNADNKWIESRTEQWQPQPKEQNRQTLQGVRSVKRLFESKADRRESPIDASIRDLYTAIGRSAVDKGDEANEQLQQAIDKARSAMKRFRADKDDEIADDLAEQLESLESALNAVLRRQDEAIEETTIEKRPILNLRFRNRDDEENRAVDESRDEGAGAEDVGEGDIEDVEEFDVRVRVEDIDEE